MPPASCSAGVQISEASISGTSHPVTGLTLKTAYSFRICAVNAHAVPNVSSGATISGTTIAEALPPDPVGPTTTTSGLKITLSWTSGGGTTKGYRIAYQTGGTAPASCSMGTQIPIENISGTSYMESGLTNNTKYSFRICALNGNAVPDVSDGATVSATIPLPVCGGSGDNCYAESTAMSTAFAATPAGKILEYVFANGSSGFKVWKELGGSRILQANGLDGWQKRLNSGGKGWSATDFTTMAEIAGRVCPPNVYLDDTNRFTTGNCLYYDAGSASQTLDAATGTAGVDRLVVWNTAGTGNNTGAAWYEGNIKTCNDKWMRLPTVFESNTTTTTHSYYPTANGSPTFAQGNGVPRHANGFTWTASAYSNGSSNYWGGVADLHLLRLQFSSIC